MIFEWEGRRFRCGENCEERTLLKVCQPLDRSSTWFKKVPSGKINQVTYSQTSRVGDGLADGPWSEVIIAIKLKAKESPRIEGQLVEIVLVYCTTAEGDDY